MRIAIIGARGQLGTDLLEVLQGNVVGLGHADIEISDAESVEYAIERVAPDCVINAAAYNRVDIAEDEPIAAWATNSLGPRNLAIACEERGIELIHVSTDYVFGIADNEQRPWTETDAPGPVSAYGTSKLAGEHFVRSLCSKHYVLRTCGLYGHAARSGAGKGNFVETMLRLGAEKDELRIISDQHCTPTSSRDLALAIAELIRTQRYGLYHATNRGASSWYEFALEIFAHEGIDVHVSAIPSSEYPTKARRPGFSVLNSTRLESAIGRPMPEWRVALHEYLGERRAALTSVATRAAAESIR